MERGVFPREVTTDTPRITVTGREQVRVEQHGGLTSFSPEEIVMRTAGGAIAIQGEALRFSAYSAAEAVILGHISRITLREGSGGER